ncbi:MAG: hypothetical protein R2849_13435 [Thermomicrobiales bacterium]
MRLPLAVAGIASGKIWARIPCMTSPSRPPLKCRRLTGAGGWRQEAILGDDDLDEVFDALIGVECRINVDAVSGSEPRTL